MADPFFTPEQAHTARVIAAGGFGASILIYIRNPGTAVRAGSLFMIGCGNAVIFTETVIHLLPSSWQMSPIAVAAALGLLGKGVAEKFLGALDRFDIAPWLGRKP